MESLLQRDSSQQGSIQESNRTEQLDLALVTSETPGPIAGVFTKNTIPAAPVILDRHTLKKGVGQALSLIVEMPMRLLELMGLSMLGKWRIW